MKPIMIAAASIGDCAHVAGILNFLKLAESIGYQTKFIGSAQSPENIALWSKKHKPDILAIGYRLAPTAIKSLAKRLVNALNQTHTRHIPKLIFGGTPPVATEAKKLGIFDKTFSGAESISEITMYLKGKVKSSEKTLYPDTLTERIRWKHPYPLLRHHFGQLTVESTRDGIKKISDAQVLDIISLGPDQNAQENFFHPEKMDPEQDGAGGVPVRNASDFEALYAASRSGNYPLMRCYSGTQNVIEFGKMLLETIHNAWTAIPLCWYNVLDRRGPRTIEQSMNEAKKAMAWHAKRNVPVEVNESHHWSLRHAPDVIAVATAYLAALNAKHVGVKDYIAQYMFNTPAATSAAMDLGKMLAKVTLIESLADDDFRVWRQVRAGLDSFPIDLDMAKGQLATSTLVSMNLKPHIVHVVAFCESDHVATPNDIIESCKIVQGVIENCISGMPDMTLSREVQDRKTQLIKEAQMLLESIAQLPDLIPELRNDDASSQPLTQPKVLAHAIKIGLLDAPHLIGNPAACGQIQTDVVNGACVTIDSETGRVLPEKERVDTIISSVKSKG